MIGIDLAIWRPNVELAERLDMPVLRPDEEHNYLMGDQRRVWDAMALNLDVIVAMAVRGCPSRQIAAGFGVTREAIDSRLRALGLKNPPGVRGRPKSSPAAPSQLQDRESASARH